MTSDKLIPPEEVSRRTGEFNINSGKTMSYIRRNILFPSVPNSHHFFPVDTSFVPHKGDSGHIVFSTKPKIILCDLKIFAGESKSCKYPFCILD